MLRKIVPELHLNYIKGTAKNAVVQNLRVFLCNLTLAVSKNGLDFKKDRKKLRVYISSRVLKHVYDKRPAEEYDFLIENLHLIVKYPDNVYKNKNGKRGNFCFTKIINVQKYFCSLELIETDATTKELEVVTFFRVPKEKYLDSYMLLWSWRDDAPSS